MFDLVSVIIPLYNAEEYLERAVESALQFEEVLEVLIIEDGSPDASYEMALTLRDRYPDRIRLFQHPHGKNLGAGPSRNLGLDMAKGEFIAFLDADDFFLRHRFEKERIIFSKHTDADGVYGAIGVHYYSEEAKRIFCEQTATEINNADTYMTTVRRVLPPEKLFAALWGVGEKNEGYFSLDAFTIRKSAIEKYQLRFDTTLRLHQDTEFLCRCAFYCRLLPGSIDEPVSVRGVHDENRMISRKKPEQIARNRFLFYDVVYRWSLKENLQPPFQTHFKVQRVLFLLQSVTGLQRLKVWWNLYRTEKDFLTNREYRPLHQKVFRHPFLKKCYLFLLGINSR